jgi:hypothetical protein
LAAFPVDEIPPRMTAQTRPRCHHVVFAHLVNSCASAVQAHIVTNGTIHASHTLKSRAVGVTTSRLNAGSPVCILIRQGSPSCVAGSTITRIHIISLALYVGQSTGSVGTNIILRGAPSTNLHVEESTPNIAGDH